MILFKNHFVKLKKILNYLQFNIFLITMKIKLTWFIAISIFLISTTNAELYYPISEMSKVDCRFSDFSTLWSDCKMQLPILKTSDYTKYKNDYSLYRRVYTILWWSTYNYGWDVWNGWHQWVDIATSKWTPVYSIADWKIVQSWFLAWRWNNVKIEHTINGRKIYSNYSHLSKIDVSLWNTIKGNTKIGEVWNTWNSFWNHLHFQIDLSISWKWPWYRSNCVEKNYDKIVNSDVCFSQLNNNTIDPLLFLETGWAVVKANIIDKPKIENIPQVWLLSREEILRREIEEFLRFYDVKVEILNLWWSVELWKSWNFRISVTDKRTKKPFNWSFPGDMNFKYDKNKFDIFPTWILQIDNWFRDFKITPKVAWKMSLDIYIWETFFKKLNFWVFDTKKSINPKSTSFWVTNNNVISETKKWLLYFKDNFWLNIIWVKFDWTYTLKSENNTMKFCLKKVSKISDLNRVFNTDCKDENFKNEISFNYSDSVSWIIVFNYKVLKEWSNNLVVLTSKNDKISSKKLNWTLPVDLKVTYPYYDDVLKISKLWFVSWINKWYFLPDRELSREDWIIFLRNYLDLKLKNCKDNNCKSLYSQKIVELSKEYSDKFSYFTRLEYITLIWKYVPIDEYKNDDYIKFRDLKEIELTYSKNILKNSTWQDYFGQTRYFQPDKKITRWEWAFLISRVLD